MTIEQLLERLVEDGCYAMDDSNDIPSLVGAEIPPMKVGKDGEDE